MRILVIEFFSAEIQERVQRKDFWLRVQASYSQRGIEILIPEQCLQNRINERRFSLEGIDQVFVHEGDNYGLTDQAVKLGKPFVCYGGRTTQGEYSRVSEFKIDFLPISLLMSNLDPFLARVLVEGKITVDALYVLIGFDPYLEDALELLHSCLTPDGRDKVSWDANGKVTIPRNGEGPFIGSIPNNQGKTEWEALKGKTDGPFGEGYIGALAALRNELLTNYQ